MSVTLVTRLRTGNLDLDSRQEFVLFAIESIPALGPTQLPIQ